MYTEINQCRVCGNKDLMLVLDLGYQSLTGIFPKSKDEEISRGPLQLVKCREDESGRFCGLVQLKQTYDLSAMYGENYGYRSGLNAVMARHLRQKVGRICQKMNLQSGDIIVDIGSNDGTLLNAYAKKDLVLIGIDPTAQKFKEYYHDDIVAIPQFFSSKILRQRLGNKRAKIITSIAMFYDVQSPWDFMQQVYDVLKDEGVWIFEQSYMPLMLEKTAYDTICHEHLAYFRLKQIHWLTQRVGFKIIDIEFNAINGGSFSITAAKKNSHFCENSERINQILNQEKAGQFHTFEPYARFKKKVFYSRDVLRNLIESLKSEGARIAGYGASTKGNVLLQFCGLTSEHISYIAEINPDKWGCFTPGTGIPIIPEQEARRLSPDYFLILPWAYQEDFLIKEEKYLEQGGKFLVSLPEVKVLEYSMA